MSGTVEGFTGSLIPMFAGGSLLALAVSGIVQTGGAVPGTMVERVACASDPTQTYTLYLPSTYDRSRRWPLLLVFDPRGRGTVAADLFREAAETYGWIIVSSNNTRSDGPWDPNGRALAALWPAVLQAYSVDARRVYAAGFSGGASVARVLARSTGNIAGIIAAGAPDRKELESTGVRSAWFGSAGRWDFNYLDARTLDDRMAAAGVPHRLEFFDGGHEWMTPELARLAVGWLEALAMKDRLRPRDEGLAARLLAEETARARQLESSGHPLEARRALGAIVEAHTGLVDVTPVTRRIQELDASETLTLARKEQRRGDDWERRQRDAAAAVLAQLQAQEAPYPRELVNRLNIASLQQRAERSGYDGETARRILELLFVQTAFYLPQALEDRREFARAATSLEVATAIHPDRPMVWFHLAAVRALSSAKKEALAALKKAVAAGFADRQLLATDERFATLREMPEYAGLVQALGAK